MAIKKAASGTLRRQRTNSNKTLTLRFLSTDDDAWAIKLIFFQKNYLNYFFPFRLSAASFSMGTFVQCDTIGRVSKRLEKFITTTSPIILKTLWAILKNITI